MNFDKVLSNPWVWGAGIVLGVLVMSAASRGAAPAQGAYDPYAYTGGGAALAANNTAAMDFMSRAAETAAATSRSNSANNLARDLKVIDAIEGSNNIWATVQAAATESAAGVTKARIEANTALAIDRGQNEVRRDQIYVAGNVATLGAQLQATVEREKTAASLKATMQANKINGDNAFWEGVGNFVLGVGKTILPFFF
jgi:hypothetical protein